jgi:hypothetical protein
LEIYSSVNIPDLEVIETDESNVNGSGFSEDEFHSPNHKIFASRLRMTEKKLQRQ